MPAQSDEPTPYKLAFFLAVNVAFFSWLAMLVIGAAWHMFDVGRPIGFWASLPIGAGLLLLAFLGSRSR